VTGRTVILFMVDQLAARWLEVAGDGVVHLPHFDALRAEGVTFTQAFSTNPVCAPARASIATGLSNEAHGVTECGYDLDPATPTFMQALQGNGWRTGGFGKLHFLTQIEDVTPDYRPYGFDEVAITEDSRVGAWLDWVQRNHPEHYRAALSTVWMTMTEGLSDYGPDHRDLRAEILAAQRAFPESTSEAYELPFPAEVSQTAWITDRACDFLRSNPDGDLFAQISYVQPHNPFTPPAEFVDRVHVDAIPAPVPAEWMIDRIGYFDQDRYAGPSYDQRDWRRDRRLYFADLAHLDHELGRVRDTLRAAGRLADTLFVFTSDHGELLHDQGLLGKWERHYDPCVRIPMIVSAPGTVAGDRPELVEHTDIAATVYDWAGIAPPTIPRFVRAGDDVPMPILMGRSLLPLLHGRPDTPWRQNILIQSNNSHLDASPRSWARTLRTPQFRFTRYLDGGGEQLFDLLNDPDEQLNLAGDPKWSQVRAELLDALLDRVAADGFPNSPRQLYKIGSW